MSTMSQLSASRIVSGLRDAVLEPRVSVLGVAPVVYCHGAAQNAEEACRYGARSTLTALARAGFTTAAVTLTELWGNATARSRIANTASWLRTNRGAAGPAVLIGSSHGAACALTYAAENPGDVLAVVGLIPVVDLDDVRDNDLAGKRDEIDAAWGVTYPAALPAGANPADRTGDFASLAIQLWVASDDTIARPTPAQTFATATNADLQDLGALGHTDEAMAAVDAAAILAFIEAA